MMAQKISNDIPMEQEKRIQIAPSILAADFACIEREVKAAQDAGADRIHCDVMDGHFVPNITFGPFIVEAVRRCVTIPLDVHLMIANPGKYIDDFCNAGAGTLTVHAEVCGDLSVISAKIRAHKVRAGVSVNPDKLVSLFIDKLEHVDQVLLMSVFAGFGGQRFIPETIAKIREVSRAAERLERVIDIEVDGGINDATVVECARAGANVFVAGSFIFGKNKDYAERIKSLRVAAERGMTEIDIRK
jgi:ribulose-phosphate 3-epimerase